MIMIFAPTSQVNVYGFASNFRTGHQHDIRAASTNLITITKCKTQLFKNSYFPPKKIWNNLKPAIRSASYHTYVFFFNKPQLQIV